MSVTARRAALRDRLVEAAEKQIARDGIDSLRARDLAREAECSVGAIYTVFDDMHGIVLAVNMRTFARMGELIVGSVQSAVDAPPVEWLIAMAEAYLAFAADHPRLWQALFDVEMSKQTDVPADYGRALDRLLDLIAAPLRELAPDAPQAKIDLYTRSLFSSIHGIVLLGVENRISGVDRKALPEALAFIIRSGCAAIT